MYPIKESIEFYIAPHNDDWQLFCGHQVFQDLKQENKKVVFIYTTADDAGQDPLWWQLGEKGAIASIQQVHSSATLKTSVAHFNNHPITQHRLNHIVSYCLRLPDGLPDGSGTPAYNFQSLKKLQEANLTISAVDQSTEYTSWQDFCNTLQEIIKFESNGFAQDACRINCIDYDSTLNPNDHSDHIATASAIRQVVDGRYHHRWWLSYYSYYCQPNIFGVDLENKQRLFTAYLNQTKSHTYAKKITRMRANEWICWGNKGYYRTMHLNHPVSKSATYPAQYMPLDYFDLLHLEQDHINFSRCVIVDEEQRAEGLRITNLLTQQTTVLNDVSCIIWNMLTQPYSIHDILALFCLAKPSTSEDTLKSGIYSLLKTLLSQKLIAVKDIHAAHQH